MNPYPRFGAMIAASTMIMLWLMYLNTYQLDHVFFQRDSRQRRHLRRQCFRFQRLPLAGSQSGNC